MNYTEEILEQEAHVEIFKLKRQIDVEQMEHLEQLAEKDREINDLNHRLKQFQHGINNIGSDYDISEKDAEIEKWKLQVCIWQDAHSDAQEEIERLKSNLTEYQGAFLDEQKS